MPIDYNTTVTFAPTTEATTTSTIIISETKSSGSGNSSNPIKIPDKINKFSLQGKHTYFIITLYSFIKN